MVRPFLPLSAIGVVLVLSGAETARTPAVTKTVIRKLPEKAIFQTVAVQRKIYAFEFVDDDLATPESLASGGDVYAYEPSSGRWEARAKTPVNKSSYSLVALNGKVYAIGGSTGSGAPTNSVEEYDPSTDAWTARRSMPTARCRIGIVVLDGKIYALGGKIQEGATTDAVEVYDPAKDTWSVRQSLSKPLMGVSAAAVNGKIYKVKGTALSVGRFEMVFDFEEYDPAKDVWTQKAPWLFEKEPLETVAIGGRLFVVGGGAFTGGSVHSLKEYEIAPDRWVFRRNMPEANAHTIHPSWTVLDGKIYTFGGGRRAGDGWMASDHAQRYDPATDRWEELPPMEEKKIGMGVAVIGKRIYVVGGEKMGASGQRAGNPRSEIIEVYDTGAKSR